jgi:hypothetical protein
MSHVPCPHFTETQTICNKGATGTKTLLYCCIDFTDIQNYSHLQIYRIKTTIFQQNTTVYQNNHLMNLDFLLFMSCWL